LAVVAAVVVVVVVLLLLAQLERRVPLTPPTSHFVAAQSTQSWTRAAATSSPSIVARAQQLQEHQARFQD
jgi:hypothetical protein